MITYYVEVEKRDGRLVKGTIRDDGLQSLWVVESDEEPVYVSVLDTFHVKQLVTS